MLEDIHEQISSSVIELTIPKLNNELDVPVELGDVHCSRILEMLCSKLT